MRNRLAYTVILLLGLFWSSSSFAVCPICTIAVGAGIGLSRWMGIDDVVTGLWVGGLTISLIFWTINWLRQKGFIFSGYISVTAIAYYLMVVFPLYFTEIIGHPIHTLWGVDKLVLGIAVGSVAFFIGAVWYEEIKKKNNGHAYFPFQKVVMPILPLLILSFVFYFITK